MPLYMFRCLGLLVFPDKEFVQPMCATCKRYTERNTRIVELYLPPPAQSSTLCLARVEKTFGRGLKETNE